MAANVNLFFTAPAITTDIRPKGEGGQVPLYIGVKDSFSFSCKNAEKIGHQTSGSGVGMAEFAEFKFKKLVDSASTDLYAALAQGGVFYNVQLLCFRPIASAKGGVALSMQWYMKWVFDYLVVKNIKWSGNEGPPEEELECKFASLTFEYKKLVSGVLVPAGEGTWNAVENIAAPAA